MQSDNIIASAWLDRKTVNVMATGCDPTMTGTVLRRQKDGSRKEVSCPVAVVDYNKYMGGVDRGDQLRGYYQSNFKSRKFYRYIAHFLFGVAVTNSFILYKLNNPGIKHINIKSFREKLALQLTENYCTRQKAGRCGGQYLTLLSVQHFPRKFESTAGTERKREKCTSCLRKKQCKNTQWFCPECKVWLCHTGGDDDCFRLWNNPEAEP